MSTAAKTINMRTDAERKRRYQLAAELSRTSLTSFVLSAADEKADRVLASYRTTTLPAEFFDAFFDSLAAEPNDVLEALAASERPYRRS